MKNLRFLLAWYAASVSALIFSLIFLIYLSFPIYVPIPSGSHYQKYKALPSALADLNSQSIEVSKIDARVVLVEQFFQSYHSPLINHAKTFINVADRYNLDFRLLPSISMQESNGGKIMPHNSYNPFGYGIYGGKVTRFESFDEAIERVGRGLRIDYLDKGLQTPQQVMAKYTPPSLQKGGAWAIGVSSFMEKLR